MYLFRNCISIIIKINLLKQNNVKKPKFNGYFSIQKDKKVFSDCAFLCPVTIFQEKINGITISLNDLPVFPYLTEVLTVWLFGDYNKRPVKMFARRKRYCEGRERPYYKSIYLSLVILAWTARFTMVNQYATIWNKYAFILLSSLNWIFLEIFFEASERYSCIIIVFE